MWRVLSPLPGDEPAAGVGPTRDGSADGGEGFALKQLSNGQRVLFVAHESGPKDFSVVDVTEPSEPKVILQTDIPDDRIRSNSLALVERDRARGNSSLSRIFFGIMKKYTLLMRKGYLFRYFPKKGSIFPHWEDMGKIKMITPFLELLQWTAFIVYGFWMPYVIR